MLKIITTTRGTLFNIFNDNLDFIYGNTCTFYGIKTMWESEYQQKYLTDFLKTYIWVTKAPKNNKSKNTNHIIEL